MKEKIAQVKTILSALPYIKKYSGKIFVIKYGGSAQVNAELRKKFIKDVSLLYLVGIKPVIVHGGGNKISYFLDKLSIETKFVDGLRVTDRDSMDIVEMVLSGHINKNITSELNDIDVKAIGINGKDDNFLKARALNFEKYGYVGEITKVKTDIIHRLLNENFVPVIAPIATDTEGNSYNINADLAASKIAGALDASKILFLTDTQGVLDKSKNLLSTLDRAKIDALKADETIVGGMIPKVDACLEAIDEGVKKAHIIDGRIEHSILLEIFTDEGIGTVVK